MSVWAFVIGFVTAVVLYACVRVAKFWRRLVETPLNLVELSHALEDISGIRSAESSANNEESGEQTEAIALVDSTLAKPAPEAKPVPVAEPLDMSDFSKELLEAPDPIAYLKDFVGKVRTQEAHAKENAEKQATTEANGATANFADANGAASNFTDASGMTTNLVDATGATVNLVDADVQNPQPMPDGLSLYLARGLEEAGLFSPEAKFPLMSFVRPFRSKTFFARVASRQAAWGDVVRIWAIEGALNRALFAWEVLVNKPQPSLAAPDDTDEAETLNHQVLLESCYIANANLTSAMLAQLGTTPIEHASMSDLLGEWGVRQALVSGFESFRLPLRLETKFRLNLMSGDVAIVASHMPALTQAASVYSSELERVIPASRQMRERAASRYTMRLALLLAGHAFRCSKRICHVFIAFNLDTPTHHKCVLTGDISREMYRDMGETINFLDAEDVCRYLGLTFELKDDVLQEVEQSFTLDSERFCPRMRYEAVDLSKRVLPSFEAQLLGAEVVSDLAINEDAHREQVAQQIVRELNGSTVHDVNRILYMTYRDSDPSVVEAGKRVAARLIEGKLSENDPLAFTQEFARGGDFDTACTKAIDLLNEDKAAEAADALTDVLAPVDALDVYSDTDEISYRNFNSYVARALYNRLMAEPGRRVQLVPDAYYSAQLLQSTAQMRLGHIEQARAFARRAQELNPFDSASVLRIVRCYEAEKNFEAAAQELRQALEYAFDLQTIALLYYRLAYMEWQLGNTKVADACYQKALMSRPENVFQVFIELQMLRMQTGGKSAEFDDVEDMLTDANIEIAPTERVTNVLIEAAQAATDAEVFPVARSFASLLSSLSNDDVMHGIASSIELDPDR